MPGHCAGKTQPQGLLKGLNTCLECKVFESKNSLNFCYLEQNFQKSTFVFDDNNKPSIDICRYTSSGFEYSHTNKLIHQPCKIIETTVFTTPSKHKGFKMAALF